MRICDDVMERYKLDFRDARLIYKLASIYDSQGSFYNAPLYLVRSFPDMRDKEAGALLVSLLPAKNITQTSLMLETLCSCIGKRPVNYMIERRHIQQFSRVDHSRVYYRYITYHAMIGVFDRIAWIYQKYGTIHSAVLNSGYDDPYEAMRYLLKGLPGISQDKNALNLPIRLFLKAMIRSQGNTDLGLWHNYDPVRLIIPLTPDLLKSATSLSLIPKTKEITLATANRLTDELERYFPNDPVRGYYALTGKLLEKDLYALKMGAFNPDLVPSGVTLY